MPTSQKNLASCCHVGLWHIADVLNALTNVRFWGQSGLTNRCLPNPPPPHQVLALVVCHRTVLDAEMKGEPS